MAASEKQTLAATPGRGETHGFAQGGAEALLDTLVALQQSQGGLSTEHIVQAAQVTHTSQSHAFGVATFYSMLSVGRQPPRLRLCDGPACWLKGGAATRAAVAAERGAAPERTSCLGLCDRAPAMLVHDEQVGPVAAAAAASVLDGMRPAKPDYATPRSGELRVMLANCGRIDPDSISDAVAAGGYEGLRKALELTPEQVIMELSDAGLQGRGGAGFPVGKKWSFVAQAPRKPKYIVCNADESEPLLFKDRVLMDTNPHQLLEGILIAGYACGASEAWIYIRGEYEPQARRLERAIVAAREHRFLGRSVLDSDFSFDIHVHRGAGAYICGEETALLESLEGNRGEPRLRPPYPPQRGFRSKPTAVNNVESLSAVPHIIRHGSAWWRSLSQYPTPGTKLYMLLGHVKRPGLFEAPFGLTLRKVIDHFGGGMETGSDFHFALCGGAAGTLVDASLMDVPIDYGSAAHGISLGGGAFLICDQTVSPVSFLRELLHFFSAESCGKCTPCRVGTWRAHQILERMAEGHGWKGDTEELRALAIYLQGASFCGLGQSVAIPMVSALDRFGAAFTASETAEPIPALRQS